MVWKRERPRRAPLGREVEPHDQAEGREREVEWRWCGAVGLLSRKEAADATQVQARTAEAFSDADGDALWVVDALGREGC